VAEPTAHLDDNPERLEQEVDARERGRAATVDHLRAGPRQAGPPDELQEATLEHRVSA